jgi:septum site-determining protein MinD
MSKIVSIHSFRGGTGKSNTTSNIAALLANQGKRVCVVDTDIQSPGIHVLFGLNEDTVQLTLNDYLWGHCSIAETAHDVSQVLQQNGLTSPSSGKLYLIPSSMKASDISRILREGYDTKLLIDGFQDLLKSLQLDYLLIDTHPGLNDETLLSITISDILLLVLRPDNQDFQGTAVTVDVARMLEVPAMLLIVNKALSSMDVANLRQQVEQAYDVPVAGVLPLSEDVVRLASGGIFSLRFPTHPWAQEVGQITQAILAMQT